MSQDTRSLEPVESIAEVRARVAAARAAGQVVGFVPTMGALHQGHGQLIERCSAEADFVVVSIFVNPTQFGPTEDFACYPRTLQSDLQTCAAAGARLVFVPSAATIYPRGRTATFVEVPGLSDVLEGAIRPGHFRGVATVVLALLEIVRPDKVVFGQKDFQQQVLIRRMLEDLHVPVEMIVAPTVRESDGLACSSRNRYLDPVERKAACVLFHALEQARRAVAGGERNANVIRQLLGHAISLEASARIDYVEVADADSLDPLATIEPARRAVALVAARFGSTRLIDNTLLSE